MLSSGMIAKPLGVGTGGSESWIGLQSAPPMLAPYSAGAAKSKLVELLTAEHEKIRLSRQERDKIACWIDLAVPFSGQYTEGMDPKGVPAYDQWLQRRRLWEAEDARNIEALIRARSRR